MPTSKISNVEIPKGNCNDEDENKFMPIILLVFRKGESHSKLSSSFLHYFGALKDKTFELTKFIFLI